MRTQLNRGASDEILAREGEPLPYGRGLRRGGYGAAVVGALVSLVAAAAQEAGASAPPGAAPSASTSASALAAEEPFAPTISESGRTWLCTLARRVIHDALLNRPAYEPSYTPRGLPEGPVEAIVRLRSHGAVLESGAGGPGSAADAVRGAALATAKLLAQRRPPFEVEDLDQTLLEIEVAGAPVRIHFESGPLRPADAARWFQPGLDGLAMATEKGGTRICPSEFFTNGAPVDNALAAIASALGIHESRLSEAEIYRFRTAHWYQKTPAHPVTSLVRGLTLIAPDGVDERSTHEAIEALGRHLLYREQPLGTFRYEYDAVQDRYTMADHAVSQAGAAAVLALLARIQGDATSRRAAEKAMALHLKGMTKGLPNRPEAAFIQTRDRSNPLGLTALLAAGMAWFPDPSQYAEERETLVRGVLSLQRESGLFLTAFPPFLEVEGQEYYPGEALVALAAQYELNPDSDILAAFDRALTWYQRVFREDRSPALAPWQSIAFAAMAQHSKREDFAAYVFEMTDWLLKGQLSPANCDYPELHGGIIGPYEPGAGASTGLYLAGLAAALDLARQRGEEERAARYERAARLALRFVIQLQVRQEETFYMRGPTEAVGGIRHSPTLALLRLDDAYLSLLGLIRARASLFGEPRS